MGAKRHKIIFVKWGQEIGKASDKIRPIIESMLAQLKYCYESEEETEE